MSVQNPIVEMMQSHKSHSCFWLRHDFCQAAAYPRLADGSHTTKDRIRVHDAFIVRYSQTDKSWSLPKHCDTSAVSFTVALNQGCTCASGAHSVNPSEEEVDEQQDGGPGVNAKQRLVCPQGAQFGSGGTCFDQIADEQGNHVRSIISTIILSPLHFDHCFIILYDRLSSIHVFVQGNPGRLWACYRLCWSPSAWRFV